MNRVTLSEADVRRIRGDAYIAHDALESLMYAPTLTPNYIAEKIGVVQRCADFIRRFAEEQNNG